MSPPIIAKQDVINFSEGELLGVAYDPRLHIWYSVHAVRTDIGWTSERREMRPQAHEPADNAIIAGLLDAAGIPRLEAGGRVLLLWERVYQLAELRLQPEATVQLPTQIIANAATRQQAQLREVSA